MKKIIAILTIAMIFMISCSKETSSPVDNTAPSIPVLSSPVDNATNVILPVMVSWTASSGASSYSLQVSANIGFSNLAYNQSGLTGTSHQVTGLINSTKYYWRVNATNSYGTSGWSGVWNYTTVSGGTTGQPCPGIPTVSYGGKTYNTVLIGSQCWLRENLDIGTMINSITSADSQKNNGIIEKYCYNNTASNCNTYGGLYQWDEAMQYVTTPGTKGICPTGWHIPTDAEFSTLKTAVNDDGNALKAIGQGTGGGAGTNTSGFSALLSGYRYNNGTFNYLGYYADFWSSSEYTTALAFSMGLYSNDSSINLYNSYKEYGFSVRCVQD